MKNISITKEDFHKAYGESCGDVQKVLKSLCPDEFEDKIKYNENKIYAVVGHSDKVYKLSFCNQYMFCRLGQSERGHSGSHGTGQKAIDEAGDGVVVFDNEKGFLKWALKQVS